MATELTRPGSEPGGVAYVHRCFPSLTATFVYREVQALREAGLRGVNIACKRPDGNEIHDEARPLVSETDYLPGLASPRCWGALVMEFLRRPIRFTRLAGKVLAARWPRPCPHPLLRSITQIVRSACLARYVRRTPAIRHLHAPFSTEIATVAWMAAELAGRSFSFASHTACDARLMPEKLRRAAFVASISRFDRQRLLAQGDKDAAGRIHIVRCGLALDASPQSNATQAPPLILSVGSLIPKKGHDILVEACAILQRKGTSFACAIIGGGPLKESLAQQIADRELGDTVSLAGPCDQAEVQQRLRRASVFALASRVTDDGDMDGIPVVLMEAMAAGVPCVSTNVSGIPELIEHEKEGLLVPEKDPQALADAIERLLNDAVLRDRIRKAAREKIEREFNIRTSAARLAELFEQAITHCASTPSNMRGHRVPVEEGPA